MKNAEEGSYVQHSPVCKCMFICACVHVCVLGQYIDAHPSEQYHFHFWLKMATQNTNLSAVLVLIESKEMDLFESPRLQKRMRGREMI